MEIQQYMSPKERDELEKATTELDEFVANFLASETEPKPERVIAWADIEIEDDLPTAVKFDTSFQTACDVLDEYANRKSVKESLAEARKVEAKATDINCFDLKPEFNNPALNQHFKIEKPTITAVIDWLRLEIIVSKAYKFKRPTQPYNDIKDFLKAEGINENPYVKQASSCKFEIDFHDVKNGKEYAETLKKLRDEYEPISLKVATLEVSIDFWNLSTGAFLLALQKSVKITELFENTDLRIYNDDGGKVMPRTATNAMKHVHDGKTIGIGHKNKGSVYIRIYFKTMDKGLDLPKDQHRTRIEINVRDETLASMGNDADNLKHLVNESFKLLKFTRLADTATVKQTAEYRSNVELFGKEISVISKSRNRRKHPDHIETHTEFNKLVSKAVSNFLRGF
ncbi:hypothetical protein [Acinetobacter sp. WCHAc060025]|uniref:hypothetical protein n=1 Tax=Acinetobacter sp. WCHAc060025 TaxID=2518625 RepID=UPI001023A52B|nr:hypothetical protein [Acinetobacter sp. WCHAc060025]RZG77455.1 hypothetical protein EXE09_03360 [Acinetobacter sp. WCHAc060025]